MNAVWFMLEQSFVVHCWSSNLSLTSLPLPQIHPITTAHSSLFIVCGEPLLDHCRRPLFICFSFDEDRSGSIDCDELLALTHAMGMTFLTEADVRRRFITAV
jgi:hypothetical protein